MDTREYIESGILEAYVLGALSVEERREVDSNFAQYPELQKEVRDIEETMFRYCQSFAINIPEALHNKIEQALPGLGANAGAQETGSTSKSRTIPLNPDYRRPTIMWRNAAALALFICSLAVNYYFWEQGNHERQERIALSLEMNKMKADQQLQADLVSEYRSSKAMMADTGIQTIVMHTVLPGHPMAATLYWSKGNGEAYVAMDALPKPPKGMQYQLWVIQNGKPVSMGTLPDDMANTPLMQKVGMQVMAGEAFAISLEKRGGNPTPTTVYVVGKA